MNQRKWKMRVTQLFINTLQILVTDPNGNLIKTFCMPKIKQVVSKLATVYYRNDAVTMTKPLNIL